MGAAEAWWDRPPRVLRAERSQSTQDTAGLGAQEGPRGKEGEVECEQGGVGSGGGACCSCCSSPWLH